MENRWTVGGKKVGFSTEIHTLSTELSTFLTLKRHALERVFGVRLWRKKGKKGSKQQKEEVFHTFPPKPYYYYDYFLFPYGYYLGGNMAEATAKATAEATAKNSAKNSAKKHPRFADISVVEKRGAHARAFFQKGA